MYDENRTITCHWQANTNFRPCTPSCIFELRCQVREQDGEEYDAVPYRQVAEGPINKGNDRKQSCTSAVFGAMNTFIITSRIRSA